MKKSYSYSKGNKIVCGDLRLSAANKKKILAADAR